MLIGSLVNHGTLQGEINEANGFLTGVISNAGLLGGQVVAERGLKGEKGDTGDTGATGNGIASISKTGTSGNIDTYTITYTNGGTVTFTVTNGIDGHSPIITASKVGKTTTIYADGEPLGTIIDGADGIDGVDGYSPTANVSKAGDTATITITDENGTTTASITDGTDGVDGYSPSASVSKVGDTATITITDENGTTTATVSDGADGDVQDVEVNGTSVVNNHVASVTVPTKTSDLVNDSLFARGHIGAFHGSCTTAAATAEKAVTCADFKASDLVAGAMILVTFSNTNSGAVADLQLNVNSTGAYPIKQNNSGTLSNLDSAGYLKTGATYPFIFNGSYWITWYNTNTNTIGYTIRTNGQTLPVKTACYRYRICFTSPDGKYYVPANASTSTSATASKTVTTEKIDPFGRIIYYSTTTAISANGTIGTAYQMQQYNGVTLGYSFNRTGAALTMTANKAVYVKCAPQTDGSAIIDDTTPFVQDLPTTEDGKIYIFLGVATAATTIEFTLEHPVYYYKDGGVRQWTNASFGSGSVTDVTQNGTSVLDGTVAKVVTHDVPSGGTSGQVLSKDSNDDYDLAWITVSGGGGDVVYATSSDTASTVSKTATIVSGTLSTLTSGVQAIVKFAETNTASSPTLNIGGTGAKSIKRYGTTAVGQNQNESWVAGSPVLFVYDGTNWVIAGWLNTTYSGGTSTGITTGTDNLNYIWSPKQIHDGIVGLATDVNVTQTSSTPSSYTYWRPLVVGNSSNATEGFTPSTTTAGTYTFNTLEVQPSSGTIRMGGASMYKGSYTSKISPTTLTANRTITIPNATGTMALTSDIHNVPSGGSAGQVLSKTDGTDYNVSWATPASGVFVCEYGVTTYIDVKNAYDAGKDIVCKYDTGFGDYYYFPLNYYKESTGNNDGEFWFSAIVERLIIYEGNLWDIAYYADDNPNAYYIAEFDSNAKMNSTDMSAQDVSDFVDSLNVTGIHAVDYIVEQGTNANGTYIKWNSGKLECYGQKKETLNITSTANNTYYTTVSFTYPAEFHSAPMVFPSLSQDSGIFFASLGNTSTILTTTCQIRVMSQASQSNKSITVQYYAFGTWK